MILMVDVLYQPTGITMPVTYDAQNVYIKSLNLKN